MCSRENLYNKWNSLLPLTAQIFHEKNARTLSILLTLLPMHIADCVCDIAQIEKSLIFQSTPPS